MRMAFETVNDEWSGSAHNAHASIRTHHSVVDSANSFSISMDGMLSAFEWIPNLRAPQLEIRDVFFRHLEFHASAICRSDLCDTLSRKQTASAMIETNPQDLPQRRERDVPKRGKPRNRPSQEFTWGEIAKLSRFPALLTLVGLLISGFAVLLLSYLEDHLDERYLDDTAAEATIDEAYPTGLDPSPRDISDEMLSIAAWASGWLGLSSGDGDDKFLTLTRGEMQVSPNPKLTHVRQPLVQLCPSSCS